MIVVLDFQHINKPDKLDDRGAAATGINEVDIVIQYMNSIRVRLEKAKIQTVFGLHGSYTQRNEFANSLSADLYLAGHINAGGGNYALIEHSIKAGQHTKDLGNSILTQWQRILPINAVRLNSLAETDRGYSCIGKVGKPSALLLEPLFIDNPVHLAWMNTPANLFQLGTVTADVIISWLGK